MNLPHAVVWTDHHHAKVMRFDADNAETVNVKAHSHPTGQHGSAVRDEHEFFAHVCDAVDTTPEVLVVGPRSGLHDFQHYVTKHRPATGRHIVAWDVVDHPSDNQLLALGRKWFADRAAGLVMPQADKA
jgi:hypothetical protein